MGRKNKNSQNNQQQSPIQVGETLWFGGGIQWLGSVCLPRGQRYSLDPENGGIPTSATSRPSRRQLDAARAMQESLGNADWRKPWHEAALQIEMNWTLERQSDPSKLTMNETAFIKTHRWIISVLPSNTIQSVIDVVIVYRDALRNYIPLLEIGELPAAPHVFSRLEATEENRPDIIALMNELFRYPDPCNCFVYSECDKEIAVAWLGYNFEPEDSSKEEIIDMVQSGEKVLDPGICYWCEKSKLTNDGKTLSRCAKCQAVSYCCKEHQKYDWVAFHKQECKRIVASGNTGKLLPDMKLTRMETLGQDGAERMKFPIEISPDDDKSVWRGDKLLLYLISPSGNLFLDEKTLAFPRGMHVDSREVFNWRERSRN